MKRLVAVLLAGTCVLFGAGAAFGWNASGKVLCDDTVKTPLEGVTVIVEGVGQTVTDSTGSYNIGLPDVEATYTERLGEGLPPDAVFVIPSSNELILNITNSTCCGQVSFDWLISSSVCKRACWLTGGGVKFSSTSHHPLFNFGGNVNPGCSPTAGNGGQWNHIDHEQNLHFQGTAIQVVRCGNVTGIPEGSKSPITPFNFIEFKGSGTLKGIKGNKADYGTVYFFARAEDRNEPGNEKANGAKGGDGIDRYFLNVFSNPNDPVGSSLLLVDLDGNPATIDPITITGGNLQIHISGCDKPPKP